LLEKLRRCNDLPGIVGKNKWFGWDVGTH